MRARSKVSTLIALGVALVLVVSPATPASAGSWDEVDFEGSGWGHGVGLSQYGAQAMATTGSGYQAILAHYYQGTSVQQVAESTALWVNLERNFPSKSLAVHALGAAPAADVTVQSGATTLNAKAGGSIAISLAGSSGCSVTVTNPGEAPGLIENASNCSVDFSWYAWADPLADPTTKVEIVGCTLPDWNTPGGTVWRPCEYAYGFLHLRHGPGGLDLSAEMLIDDYILGISEMPYSWRLEALKSQAVAARSYAEGRRIVRGNPATNSCDGWCHVKDTTSDQRYVGWGHVNTSPWIQATEGTAREVLTHPDSSIGVITAYYSSSSGGRTEFGHEKGFASGPVEWLTSVDDSWAVDGTVWNPNASWVKTVTAADVASAVGLDFLTSVKITKTRPGSGSAAELEFWGLKNGQTMGVTKTGSWARSTFGLKSEYISVDFRLPGDEMLFYASNGGFRYEDLNPDGTFGPPILTGSGYTSGWKAITSIDLDGDAQDEIFFYREDGLFRFYEINPDATIGAPILAGSGYTTGWDAITAVDLDGDGQDEMFFYRSDGLFRYYDIKPNGAIGAPILAGSGYTTGWDAITAVDLDGDGQDEMFFYRSDGLFRYYDIKPNGAIGTPILAGSSYTTGWDAITAVDLDGDGQDEMFFYRTDGLYRYYDVQPNGTLSSPIRSGSDYTAGWSVITAIDLDGF